MSRRFVTVDVTVAPQLSIYLAAPNISSNKSESEKSKLPGIALQFVVTFAGAIPVSYTHLTLPTICSV